MKHLRIIFTIILALFVLVRPALAQDSASALEYKVKAVVLFNFAKYVKWPEKSFTSPDQDIQVCVLGKNPFGDIFNSPEAPKEAQGRPLKVVELPDSSGVKEVSQCKILFWTDGSEKKASELHKILEANSVLTVSDQKSENSLISFVLDDGKVRFKIRHKVAKGLGLEISSQLLKLAILDE